MAPVFGGLELTTLLSGSLGDSVDVTLIDKNDSFMFGFSKFDIMFGHATADALRLPYRNFAKPGVRLVQQTVTAIDPVAKRVTSAGQGPGRRVVLRGPAPPNATRAKSRGS